MQIFYKCSCMKKEQAVLLRDRLPDEPLEHWMELLSVSIGSDHKARNLLCLQKTMEYVKVPLEESIQVGSVPTKN